MSLGFYKRRRGILEHLEAGRLSLLDLGIHDFICLKANSIVGNGSIFPPGVWHGSAAAILANCPCGNISERMIQRSLQHLEKIRFLKRWRVPGKHGNYPILISRFSVRTQAGKEYIVNTSATTDWRQPELEAVSDGVGEGVGDVTPNKEVRSKNTNPELLRSSSPHHKNGAETPNWPEEDVWLKDFLDRQSLLQFPEGVSIHDPKWWERTSISCNGITLPFLEREFAKMGNWLDEHPKRNRRPTETIWKKFCRALTTKSA